MASPVSLPLTAPQEAPTFDPAQYSAEAFNSDVRGLSRLFTELTPAGEALQSYKMPGELDANTFSKVVFDLENALQILELLALIVLGPVGLVAATTARHG